MGYKNRYLFIKRTYPKTIVIFNKNNEYKGYREDKEFLEFLKFKKLNNLNKLRINYIVIQNMTILEYKDFNNESTLKGNMYDIYYARFNLFKLVNFIRQRRR